MSDKNYIVDNSIVGMILNSLSKSNIKLKSQNEEVSKISYFFSPSSLVGIDIKDIQLDTSVSDFPAVHGNPHLI